MKKIFNFLGMLLMVVTIFSIKLEVKAENQKFYEAEYIPDMWINREEGNITY